MLDPILTAFAWFPDVRLGCTPAVVSSALLDWSPVHTQSVVVQEQCPALSAVLLKPEHAAVNGEHVYASCRYDSSVIVDLYFVGPRKC